MPACKHGQLDRVCEICDLEKERDFYKGQCEHLAEGLGNVKRHLATVANPPCLSTAWNIADKFLEDYRHRAQEERK